MEAENDEETLKQEIEGEEIEDKDLLKSQNIKLKYEEQFFLYEIPNFVNIVLFLT